MSLSIDIIHLRVRRIVQEIFTQEVIYDLKMNIRSLVNCRLDSIFSQKKKYIDSIVNIISETSASNAACDSVHKLLSEKMDIFKQEILKSVEDLAKSHADGKISEIKSILSGRSAFDEKFSENAAAIEELRNLVIKLKA